MKKLLLAALLFPSVVSATPYTYEQNGVGKAHINFYLGSEQTSEVSYDALFALTLDPEGKSLKLSGEFSNFAPSWEGASAPEFLTAGIAFDDYWSPVEPSESSNRFFDPVTGLFGSPYALGQMRLDESLFGAVASYHGIQSWQTAQGILVYSTINAIFGDYSVELHLEAPFTYTGAQVPNPEPATGLLMLAGVWAWRRKKGLYSSEL